MPSTRTLRNALLRKITPVRLIHDQRGGTLIEMTIVLPIFFLLLFGIFEFSIILCGYCSATFACRAGTRFASVRSSTSIVPATTASVTSAVTAQVWAPSGTITVTPTWPSGNTVGNTVNVAVTIVYPMGLLVVSTAGVTVSSSAQRAIVR